MNKPGWLKDTTATPQGYMSPNGELLKSARLSDEHIAMWNEAAVPAAPEPQMLTEADPIEEMTNEAFARTKGVELDRRKKKSTLVEKVKVLAGK